jgi:aspartate aminotransferase
VSSDHLVRSDEPCARSDSLEDLDALLEPLESFGRLHTTALRRWGPAAIDLSYPNAKVERDPRGRLALAELADRLTQQELQYTPFGGMTPIRRRIAAGLSRQVGVRFGHRDILLTPGGTAALTVAFTALLRPGCEVVVTTPCWMDYPLYLHHLGISCRLVPTKGLKKIDLAAIEAAWGPRTHGMIISQPNCPTGVMTTPEELAELGQLLQSLGDRGGRLPVLVSDEVHRDLTWGEADFVSPLRHYPQSLSIYSFGKAWTLQGQRTGYLALSPTFTPHDTALHRLERTLRVSGIGAPTALMQRVAGRLCGLEPDHRAIGDDQRRLRRELTDAGYQVIPAQAGSFVYVESPEADELAFTHRLAMEHGLLVMPSRLFHEPGFFRIALNEDRRRLTEAVERLAAARLLADSRT